MATSYIIRTGQVESNTDDQGGGRIKVRLYEDNNKSVSELAYAFPLMPKVFSVTPKVGEAVLIFTEALNNPNTQRFYIGPIISQAQYFEKDEYERGNGTAASLLTGTSAKPSPNIKMNSQTTNSFPKEEDVAVVGRQAEDIIIKPGEINIRCGIKTEATNSDDSETLKGKVVFNNIDPAYIQLKYQKNLTGGIGKVANSVISLVADKINLIGLNRMQVVDSDSPRFDTFGKSGDELNQLITQEQMQTIMNDAQPAVFGDTLERYLNMLRGAILNHAHPYPGLPPLKTDAITLISKIDFSKIKSDNVRLN